jgi:opacity protein-like surface antigen
MTVRPIALLALVVPALALAAPTTAGKSAAAKPGARSAPAPAHPTPRTSQAAAPSQGGLELGGFVGYEAADFSGPSLRLDAELPLRQAAGRLKLSVLGSLGYSRLTWNPGFGVKATADVVKLAPALRLTLPLARRFSIFGDVGVGVAYVSAKVDLPAAFAAPSFTDSTLNLMLRLGAGAWYHATERLKLGVLLELDPIFGDFGFKTRSGVTGGSQTTFLALVGAQVRL